MYYIDNETKGTAKAVKVRKMKTFYSVEIEANSYMDDIITGTLAECREWCKNHGYTNEDGRIVEYLDDGDPLVTAFYDIEY